MSVVISEALPADPLDALRALADGEAELGRLRRDQVAAARSSGASWQQVGEALGISRQSAWESFAKDVSDMLAANVEKNEMDEADAMQLAVDEVKASRQDRRSR